MSAYLMKCKSNLSSHHEMLRLHWAKAELQPLGTHRQDCKSCTDTRDVQTAGEPTPFTKISLEKHPWMLPLNLLPFRKNEKEIILFSLEIALYYSSIFYTIYPVQSDRGLGLIPASIYRLSNPGDRHFLGLFLDTGRTCQHRDLGPSSCKVIVVITGPLCYQTLKLPSYNWATNKILKTDSSSSYITVLKGLFSHARCVALVTAMFTALSTTLIQK